MINSGTDEMPQNSLINHPNYFSQALLSFKTYIAASNVSLILVPQEGNLAGKPTCFDPGHGTENSIPDSIVNLLIYALENDPWTELSTIQSQFGGIISPIVGRFGVAIGFLIATGVRSKSKKQLQALADRVARHVEKSKKSRLHDVVAADFIINRDSQALFDSVAKTVKHGLYCNEVIVWVKEGKTFKSYGLQGWDLLESNSLVKRAYDGEIIIEPDLSNASHNIRYKSELEQIGVKSFFLCPVRHEVSNEPICIVGVFFQRKFGTTDVDLELVSYIINYFEHLWTLYSKNNSMFDKLEFFDDILNFHDESIKCMVSFHEIKSIFQVLESQVSSASTLVHTNRVASDQLSVAMDKIRRGSYLLDMYADTFATAGALDEKLDVPVGDKIRKIRSNQYLEAYLNSYSRRAKLENIEYEYTLENIPYQMRLDLDHLELIIDNFLTNAFFALNQKQSGKPCISILIKYSAPWIEISVEDNGPGIEPSLLPHVFTVSVTTRLKEGGQGIGLALVWRVGIEHKRRPIVASKWGHGAKFSAWMKPVKVFDS